MHILTYMCKLYIILYFFLLLIILIYAHNIKFIIDLGEHIWLSIHILQADNYALVIRCWTWMWGYLASDNILDLNVRVPAWR